MAFQGEGKFAANTYPPAAPLAHFAAHQGDSLISYAATIRLELEHSGAGYQVCGPSNMFTFPRTAARATAATCSTSPRLLSSPAAPTSPSSL